MSLLVRLICAILVMAFPSLAIAQQYPGGIVTMVIPFTPGGSNDIVGRYLAQGLSDLWKNRVIVENRAGAGSLIGTAYVARSQPDGLTLLFVSSSYTAIAAAKASLPYDPLKDLKPVGLGAFGQMVVVTGSRVPMRSLAELSREARARTILYGTAGLAGSGHFASELLNDVAGMKMEPVHYRGGTEALIDIAGGRTDVYVGTVTQVLPFVENKSATPIAITSKTRSPLFPDVPTVAEAGMAGAESDLWWGVFAPSGTPPDIVARIHESINEVMNSPEATSFLAKQGAYPARLSLDELAKLTASELAKWKTIATKHGISLN